MESRERRLKSEGKQQISNSWLTIGSCKDRVHFATAKGDTRPSAEAREQEQFRKDGSTCTIATHLKWFSNQAASHVSGSVRWLFERQFIFCAAQLDVYQGLTRIAISAVVNFA